jgi:hypothetical protein
LSGGRHEVLARALAGCASWLALTALSLAFAGAAQAAIAHEFLKPVSEELGQGVPAGCGVSPAPPACIPGPLSLVSALTADSGHVWVAEKIKSKSRVDQFNGASGAFTAPQLDEEGGVEHLETGVAVGHPGGEQNVYVGAGQGGSSVVAVFGPTGKLQPEGVWSGKGTPEGSFGTLTSLAVDSSGNLETKGDLYVATSSVVDVFAGVAGGKEPAKVIGQILGAPEAPSVGGHFASPSGVAVSPLNGDVLVADGDGNACEAGTAKCAIDVFEPAPGMPGVYNFLFKIAGAPGEPFKRIGPLAVDGEGEIYVVEKQTNVVDQFDATGKYRGRLTGTPEGPFKSPRSVAVDPLSGELYVGDFNEALNAGAVDAFAKGKVVPDVATSGGQARVKLGPGGEGQIEATLSGTVNPLGEGNARCAFAWGASKALGSLAPCSPEEVPNGNGEVAVQGTIKAGEGLAPDSDYTFRLQASDKNGVNPGEEADDKELLTPGPGIHSSSANDVSSTSATLNATIDPNEAPTSYYFQYGTSSAYEAQVPAAPGAPLGAGKGDVAVTPRHLQGLIPGSVYHYRVIAVSTLEAEGKVMAVPFPGPDQTFKTQGAAGSELPDGRHWELVSPPDKHGAVMGAIGESGVSQAAAAGGAVSYIASVPTEEGVKGYIYGSVQVLSSRGEAGWSSKDISLPHASATAIESGFGEEYRAFSADLSLALVEPLGFDECTSTLSPETSPPDTERTVYLRDNGRCVGASSAPGACFEPLLTGAPGAADVPSGTAFGGCGGFTPEARLVGASGDLSHAVLTSGLALTARATGGNVELYEFSGASPPTERLQLISLLPANTEGKEEPAKAGAEVFLGLENTNARHAVSEDGSRVVWSTARHLYMRDTAKGQSIQLDVPEAQCQAEGQCGEPGRENARFQLASADGSRVLFTDSQRLLKDAGRVPERADLYQCLIEEVEGGLRCALSDLTPSPGTGKAADVQGMLIGASEDGAWAYFVANGVLGDGGARGAGTGSCNGGTGAGQCNLYVEHEGTIHLVAVLSGADKPDWDGGAGSQLPVLTARVSPDGEYLAFMSQRSLSGYDNVDANSPAGEPHHDEEVFLYHAEGGGSGSLLCASCDPSGARPVGVQYAKLQGSLVGGDAVWPEETWIAANVPGWTPYELLHALYQSRYLSDSGRLFFNTNDALVPQDINKNQDVYQFEPAGVGSCSGQAPGFSAITGGCVALISSGRAAGESGFLDASQSGDDVFFLTGERLVPKDLDTAVDVYDAHVCSPTAPCVEEPRTPPPCTTAEACRQAPAPQPQIFGQPSSGTFSGEGNVPAPPPPPPPKPPSNAQKLAKALSSCRHTYKKAKKRQSCERQAHKRYPVKAAKKAAASSGKRGGR